MTLRRRVFTLMLAALSLGGGGCSVRSVPLSVVPGDPLPLALVAPQVAYGTLRLSVKWPERPLPGFNTAAIPTTTNTLTIQVRQGPTLVAETVVNREPGAAGASAILQLKAATGLDVEVRAYRELLSDVAALAGCTPIARGTAAGVDIVRSQDTTKAIVLDALFAPAIAGLSTNNGGIGESLTILGANFGSGSIPIQLSFNGATASVTRLSETSLTTTVPAGAKTGNLVVTADGIRSSSNATFWLDSGVTLLGAKESWDTQSPATTSVVLLGKNCQLSASPSFVFQPGESVATYGGTSPGVSWWRSNPEAGAVDDQGVFLATRSVQTTQLRAQQGPFSSEPWEVRVEDFALTLSPTSVGAMGGKGLGTQRFRALHTLSDGATYSLATYMSQEAASISIAADGTAQALDFGNNGSITITATSQIDSQRQATASVALSNYVVSTLAGSGTWGTVDATGKNASLNDPETICVDPDGIAWIADAANATVRRLNLATKEVTTMPAPGHRNGVAWTADGLTMFGAYSVWRVAADGTASLVAGSSGEGDADGDGAAASFRMPVGMAAALDGGVYVATAHAVRHVSRGGTVTTVAGSEQGSQDGPVASALFNSINAIAADGLGNVYVIDKDSYDRNLDTVRKISADGVVSTMSWSRQVLGSRFYGMTADAQGNVYVADTDWDRIYKITPDATVLPLAGSQPDGYKDGIGTNARFFYPMGMVVLPSGQIVVADAYGGRIRLMQ